MGKSKSNRVHDVVVALEVDVPMEKPHDERRKATPRPKLLRQCSCESTELDALMTVLGSDRSLSIDYGSESTQKPQSDEKFFLKKRIVVSAIANLSTAYNLAVINYAMMMIRQTYPPSSPRITSTVVSCSLVGAILGQLTFGYIGDAIGRKKGMILTLLLTIAGSITSALVPWGTDSIYYLLAGCRFVLGLGVGGVYPLSATTAIEACHDDVKNSKMVAAVFSFQGCGQLLAPLATYFLLWLRVDPAISWRLLLGAGAIPGLFVLQQAFEAKETCDQRALETPNFHERRSLSELLQNDQKLRDKLIGAAIGWFLFDVTFYGNVIFTPMILEDLYAFDRDHLPDVAYYSFLVAVVALPGYLTTVWAVGRLNFKTIQLLGFMMMALLFFALGSFYSVLLHLKTLLLILYALTFFFSNFGPNVSTFCLPAEIFPPDVRVKLNGIAAASGKVGATVGAAFFGVIEKGYGVEYVLVLSGLVSLLGAVVTQRFIPAKDYHS